MVVFLEMSSSYIFFGNLDTSFSLKMVKWHFEVKHAVTFLQKYPNAIGLNNWILFVLLKILFLYRSHVSVSCIALYGNGPVEAW